MYTEDVIVSFKGFKPSPNVVTTLQEVASHIHMESPSESCVRATFSRTGKNKFQGAVKINSSIGHFYAMAKDYNLNNVTHKLVHRIRKQLNRWKTLRFMKPRNAELSVQHAQ